MKDGNPDGNVISFMRGNSAQSDALRALETYWAALADGRLMPKRSEVDPRGVAGTLDRTFLLECIAPGHARFRVAGSRLSQILDMDLRGMPFSALFHPAARPELAQALTAVFTEPARLTMRLDGGARLALRTVWVECLILPLRDDDGQVTRAIGCLDWAGPAAPPHRFRIRHQGRRTLTGYADHREPPAPPSQKPPLDPRKKRPDAPTRPTLVLVT